MEKSKTKIVAGFALSVLAGKIMHYNKIKFHCAKCRMLYLMLILLVLFLNCSDPLISATNSSMSNSSNGLVDNDIKSEDIYKQYATEGVRFFKERDYKKAIETWEKIPPDSEYYARASEYIKAARKKISEKPVNKSEKKLEGTEKESYFLSFSWRPLGLIVNRLWLEAEFILFNKISISGIFRTQGWLYNDWYIRTVSWGGSIKYYFRTEPLKGYWMGAYIFNDDLSILFDYLNKDYYSDSIVINSIGSTFSLWFGKRWIYRYINVDLSTGIKISFSEPAAVEYTDYTQNRKVKQYEGNTSVKWQVLSLSIGFIF